LSAEAYAVDGEFYAGFPDNQYAELAVQLVAPGDEMIGYDDFRVTLRLEDEIDAQATAHLLADDKWRVDIVERSPNREPVRVTAYATIDVSVEAERNVQLNPWGVFVTSFSIDPVQGGR
jgi:hypothetical protein